MKTIFVLLAYSIALAGNSMAQESILSYYFSQPLSGNLNIYVFDNIEETTTGGFVTLPAVSYSASVYINPTSESIRIVGSVALSQTSVSISMSDDVVGLGETHIGNLSATLSSNPVLNYDTGWVYGLYDANSQSFGLGSVPIGGNNEMSMDWQYDSYGYQVHDGQIPGGFFTPDPYIITGTDPLWVVWQIPYSTLTLSSDQSEAFFSGNTGPDYIKGFAGSLDGPGALLESGPTMPNSLTLDAVPEPSSWCMAIVGILGFSTLRRPQANRRS